MSTLQRRWFRRAGTPVVDLTEGGQEPEVMPRWERWAFGIALAAVLPIGIGGVVLAVAELTVPSAVPFELFFDDDRARWHVTLAYDPGPVQRGDVLIAIDGRPLVPEDIAPRTAADSFDVRRRSEETLTSTLGTRREFVGTFGRTSPGDTAQAITETFDAPVHLVRAPSWSVLGTAALPVVALAALVLGFLALRAPATDVSRLPFLALCLLTGGYPALYLVEVWLYWRGPFLFSWSPFDHSIFVRLLTWLAWPLVYAAVLRQFMRVLSGDAESSELPTPRNQRSRWWGHARNVLSLALIGAVGVSLVLVAEWAGERGPPTPVGFLRGTSVIFLIMVIPAALIYAFVTVPVRIYRLAGAMRREEGTSSRRIEAVLIGIRAGAAMVLLALGSTAALGVIYILMNSGVAEGPIAVATLRIAELLGDLGIACALLLPMIGVFIAVTRSGLWDADTVLQRATTASGMGIALLLFWGLAGVGIEQALGGRMGNVLLPGLGASGTVMLEAVAAPALAAMLVAGIRRPLSRTAALILFPRSRELGPVLDRLAAEAAVGEAPTAATLGGRLLQELQADGGMIVRLGDGRPTVLWEAAMPVTPRTLAARAGPAFSEASCVIGTTPQGPLALFRVGTAERVRGFVAIRPGRGTDMFDTSERHMLSLALNLLVSRLLNEDSGSPRPPDPV